MNHTLACTIVAFVANATLSGCAATPKPQPQPDQASVASSSGAEKSAPGAAMPARCPLKVPDTTVAASDVEGGAALVFTTKGDETELRKRVEAMAAMHNRVHAGASAKSAGGANGEPERSAGECPGMHEGGMMQHGGAMHEGGMTHGGGMMQQGGAANAQGAQSEGAQHAAMMPGHKMMPPSTATAENMEHGARLVLRPSDPAQLEALRQHVRAHAEHMARGECPMNCECPMMCGAAAPAQPGETQPPPAK